MAQTGIKTCYQNHQDRKTSDTRTPAVGEGDRWCGSEKQRQEGVGGDKEAGTEETRRGPSGLLEEVTSHGEWPTERDTLHLG